MKDETFRLLVSAYQQIHEANSTSYDRQGLSHRRPRTLISLKQEISIPTELLY